MATDNKYWLVWIEEMPTNVECLKLVYCKTEQEALELGSKIHNMDKNLLEVYEKTVHVRKSRSKLIDKLTNEYWIVYFPDLDFWESELVFCDTGENAIKSTLYIRSVTSKQNLLAKPLKLYTQSNL